MRLVLHFLALVLCMKQASGQDYGYTGNADAHIRLVQGLGLYLKSQSARLDGLIDNRDIRHKARETLETMANSTMKDNLTLGCWQEVSQLLNAMEQGEKWALAFVDSFGKPSSGVMHLNLVWLGDWNLCVNGPATFGKDDHRAHKLHPVAGKYCMAEYMVSDKEIFGVSANMTLPLRIGVCYPNLCSSTDVKVLLNIFFGLTSLNTSSWTPKPEVSCQDRHIPFDTRAIVVLALCGILVALILAGTAIDIFHVQRKTELQPNKMDNSLHKDVGVQLDGRENTESVSTISLETNSHKGMDTEMQQIQSMDTINNNANSEKIAKHQTAKGQGLAVGLLVSFSLYTNVKKLLDTGSSGDTMSVIHGIRLISMLWVIVSHSYSWMIDPNIGNPFMIEVLFKRFTMSPFANGSFAVDVFFALSGILVAYSTLGEFKKRGGVRKFPWVMFYFHRYWRLTPVYLFWILFYSSLMKYWTQGPLWDQDGFEENNCDDMWRNVLYINNLVDSKNHCMAWSYYLANDMQFYILSPLMLIPLYRWPRIGVLSTLTFLLTGMVSPGVVSRVYDLPPANFYNVYKMYDYFNKLYVKPWCRVGPYAVGVFTGYLLYRNDLIVKIPKVLNFFGWILAFGLSLLVVYGLFTPGGEGVVKYISPDVTALYNATSRSVIGACIAWAVFASVTGNGGPFNAILSWRGFVPLSRLTYCAYLVHPVILTFFMRSRPTVFYMDDYSNVYLVIGNIVVSFFAAFVLSMAMERPFMVIEKIMLGAKR